MDFFRNPFSVRASSVGICYCFQLFYHYRLLGFKPFIFFYLNMPTLLSSWRRSWSSWRVFGEKGNHTWWQRRTWGGGTGEQVQRLKQENNVWPRRLCLMRTVTVAVSRQVQQRCRCKNQQAQTLLVNMRLCTHGHTCTSVFQRSCEWSIFH